MSHTERPQPRLGGEQVMLQPWRERNESTVFVCRTPFCYQTVAQDLSPPAVTACDSAWQPRKQLLSLLDSLAGRTQGSHEPRPLTGGSDTRVCLWQDFPARRGADSLSAGAARHCWGHTRHKRRGITALPPRQAPENRHQLNSQSRPQPLTQSDPP